MRYSPLPIEDYHLAGVSPDFVDCFQEQEHGQALWNLFWLSNATVDLIPGTGKMWWKGYKSVQGGIQALLDDVTEDRPLREHALKPPGVFAEWFRKEDHSIYDAYPVFGGETWVQTVLSRADEAAARLAEASPRVVVSGNVLNVDFRRRRA